MSSLAVELGAAYVSILPDTSRIAPDIKKAMGGAEKEASKAGGKAGTGFGGGFTKAVKGVGIAAGAAIAAGVGMALKGGWDTALNLDSAERTLTGLYDSADVAGDALERVLNVSKNSSIDTSSYLEAAENFAYLGVEGESLEKILDNVGTMIVGVGGDASSLDSVSSALATAQNMGRVTLNEINQLSKAGVPIFDMLMEQFGMTSEEVTEHIKNGGVEVEDLLKAMEDPTGKWAERTLEAGRAVEGGLAATWSRVKDNITTALGISLRESDFFSSLAPALETAGDAIVGLIEGLDDAFQWVKDNSGWLGPIAAAILGIATAMTVWTIATGIATGVQAAFAAVMAVTPLGWLVIGIGALVGVLVWLVKNTEIGKKVWDWLVEAFKTGWEWIKNAFQTAWDLIVEVWNGIMDAFQAAWDFIFPILQGIWDFLSLLGQIIFAVFAMPFVLAWQIISAIVEWAWGAVIQPIFEFIKQGLSTLGEWFGYVWSALIEPAWNALGTGIRWVVDNVVNPAFDFVKSALQAVGDFFGRIWTSVISPVWNALGDGIRWVIDNVINPAFEVLKTALGKVGDWFGKIVDGIKNAWDALKGHVARPINWVIDVAWNRGLREAWNTIAGFLPGLSEMAPLSPVAFATGGAVSGPGTGTSDSILARLSHGEHVLTAAEVKALGGQSQVYAMREMIRNGVWPMGHGADAMPKFRDGGEVGTGVRLSPTPGEGGLEAIAILAKRLIHRIWPSITTIGGYRGEDGYGEHSSGRALDVMVGVGNPIGDEVTSWALANDPVLPLNWAIWKQQMWYPGVDGGSMMPDRGNPTQNHMDHPHLYYKPHAIDPNVVPEGLVGHDGLTREDREGVIQRKIREIIERTTDPLIEAIAGVIGSPPPEFLDVPPRFMEKSRDALLDGSFEILNRIQDDLKDVYNAAKDVKDIVVSRVTGLFRDNGGYIPTGQSVVTNETGKPEAVLNWDQLQQIIRLMESSAGMAALHRWAMGDIEAAMRHGVDRETIDSIGAMNLQFAEHLADVWRSAHETFFASAKSGVLDFFGLSGLVGGIEEIWAAFNPAEDATNTASTVGTAAGSPAASTPGDYNYELGTETIQLETHMPDLDGTPGSGPIVDQVKEAMASSGWDVGAQWSAVDFIVTNESSWNPLAQNPTSTAYGLFQFLDSTWATVGATKTDNPKLQGEAGEAYIGQRYGDPLGAERFWRANRWYDSGGWLGTGLSLVRNSTGKPEPVLNPSQWADISRQSQAVADLVDGQGSRRGAPLVVIENLHAKDEDEAFRSAMREARRASRSNSLIGGW